MKGLYYNGTAAEYREDLPMPVPEPGESLIKIHYSAVCNTDKEIRKGYRPSFRGVMGHEFEKSSLLRIPSFMEKGWWEN